MCIVNSTLQIMQLLARLLRMHVIEGVFSIMAAPSKPLCKYGSKCYRKNPEHLRRFSHPLTSDDDKCSSDESPGPAVRIRKRRDDEVDADSCVADSKRIKLSDETSFTAQHSPPAAATQDITESDALSNVSTEERPKDVLELERDKESNGIREKVKRKFLVDMPDDFYQFWDFCKSIKPNHPETALVASMGMELVGPYHVLAGRLDGVPWKKCVLHYRYFYDPPEMMTIVKRSTDQYHLGYFRDDPEELSDGVLVVSNDPDKGCEIKIQAQNIFSAIKSEVDMFLKCKSKIDSDQLKFLQELDGQLQSKMKELNIIDTVDVKSLTKQRNKMIVAKCFHKIGIVVPYDKETDVGYRSLTKTDRELLKLLDKIAQCSDTSQRDQLFEPLQEIITFVQFANDECDYGMGLELGLDLFCHGDSFLHGVVSHLLPLAYDLLHRSSYGKIVELHIANRQSKPLDFSISQV